MTQCRAAARAKRAQDQHSCFQATATYSVVRAHNLLWCGGDTGLEGRQEGLMEILLAHFSVEVVPGVTVRSFQRV